MEIHIVAGPQPLATLIQDALVAQWPFARVVPIPDHFGSSSSVYRPPTLALLFHNHTVEHTSADIVAIRRISGCPIVVSAPQIPEPIEIAWLQLGADVVVGSVSPARLVAIVGALMRRTTAHGPVLARMHTVGDLTFDVARGAVSVGSKKLPVTPTEFRLLESLAAADSGCVASIDLMSTIWGMDNAAVRKSLKVHISRLRRKLAEAGSDFTIQGVRSNGYALVDQYDRDPIADITGASVE